MWGLFFTSPMRLQSASPVYIWLRVLPWMVSAWIPQSCNCYGVDAVMIGRATFGRPWIFKEIRDYLDNTGAAPLTVDEKIDLLEEQLRINIERIDEYRGILHTRRHLAASPIFKGIPDFKQTRIAMLRANKEDELKEILKECRERIKAIQ